MSSSSIAPVNNFETNGRRSRDVAETRTSRGRAQRQVTGRYDGQKARLLPTGLGRPVPSQNARTAIANVVDPYGNGVGRIQATVSINVDILEKERSTGRISEGAYLTGRILQEAYERIGGVGSSNWLGTSKQDPMVQQELRALKLIINAGNINNLMSRVDKRLGHMNSRLVRRVLGDRLSFAQCAEATGKNGERGAGYVATQFRDALEDLTEAWTAKGAPQVVPEDKHLAASEGMVDRQRLSMVKGVTTARRAEEAREAAKRAELVRKANPARRG